MEICRKCNVCGHIYCYDSSDISNNNLEKVASTAAAIGGLAAAFGGSRLDMHMSAANMDRHKVIDFEKCPKCGSRNTSITDAKTANANSTQSIAGVSINANASTESLLRRIELFIEDEEWDNAGAYCESVLDMEPENALVYFYKILIERKETQESIKKSVIPLERSKDYNKALAFGDDSLKQRINEIDNGIRERIAEKKKTEEEEKERAAKKKKSNEYNEALVLMESEDDPDALVKAEKIFNSLLDWEDASSLAAECRKKIDVINERNKKRNKKATTIAVIGTSCAAILLLLFFALKPQIDAMIAANETERRYSSACSYLDGEQYEDAVAEFEILANYKDSNQKLKEAEVKYANSLFEQGNYKNAKYYYDRVNLDEINEKKAFCDVYVRASELSDGDNLTDLHKDILALNNFNNANDLLTDIPYFAMIEAMEGNWFSTDKDGDKFHVVIKDYTYTNWYYYNDGTKNISGPYDFKVYKGGVVAYSPQGDFNYGLRLEGSKLMHSIGGFDEAPFDRE